ncbi:clathrin light chain-domain-containing protein [Cladochytrium replicatum]|nr:clathrin light chain-domain-containing protein [Cladochytrium replicatum]
MADFGDFLESKATGNSAVLSADDPTAEFLAREQAILGADAAFFGNEFALGTATIAPASPPAQMSPAVPEFGAFASAQQMMPVLSSGTPVMPLQYTGTPLSSTAALPMMPSATGTSDAWGAQVNLPMLGKRGDFFMANAFSPTSVPLGFNNTGVSASSFAPAVPEVEPEIIREWREAYNASIADRDAKSAMKHEKILEEAKAALERFYAEYNDKKAKLIAKNRESGSGSQYEESTSGTVWDRAMKQIESSVASSSSNKKAAGNPARTGSTNAAADEKAKKAAKGRDTTRMKELLQSLRGDEAAPGLAI